MAPTKTPREVLEENYFFLGRGFQVIEGRCNDCLVLDRDKLVACFETLLEEARQDAREEVIDYISQNQGWEDSEDMYREHFGLSPKYK